MSFNPLFDRQIPQEAEGLKRYKWFDSSADGVLLYPIALVSHKGFDMILELIDGVPHLLEPRQNPDIYYGFKPVRNALAKYIRMWSKSGFYRSMHIKEFLDQVANEKEG